MRKALLILAILLVVIVLGPPLINLIVGLPDNPLTGLEPADPLTARTTEVISEKCAQCHSTGARGPFYAKLPVAGSVIETDMREGTRRVDYVGELTAPEERPVSEAVLAKTEYVVRNGNMPPFRYRMLHWNHGLGADEQDALVEWVTRERIDHYAAPDLPPEIREQVIRPVPEKVDEDERKVALGRKLFHDTRLSRDDTISCASCHGLDKGGTDQRQFSVGVGGAEGGINSPTVFNSGLQFVQFWDGRAVTLEDQADGPVNNPIEMASNWEQAIAKLRRDKGFRKAFEAVYPQGYSKESLIDAIATFERTLVTPNSAFDRYLAGDEAALTEEQKQGHALFREYACDTCHVGPAMGGQSFEALGLYADYFEDRGDETQADLGRFNVTGEEMDRHKFKVPTLRNVALTYPYLHDGSTSDLTEAVGIMARYQRGESMPNEDATKVAAFLESLTGEYDGQVLQ